MTLSGPYTAHPASTGPLTDKSGTTTLGATAQTIVAEAADRRYFLFINISSETMWVNFGTTAVADKPSIPVAANGVLEFQHGYVPGDLVSMISATTGSKFVCKVG
jgi:hypothetical protein